MCSVSFTSGKGTLRVSQPAALSKVLDRCPDFNGLNRNLCDKKRERPQAAPAATPFHCLATALLRARIIVCAGSNVTGA
jgi:hypothetical protein